jgi:hypothetical protein
MDFEIETKSNNKLLILLNQQAIDFFKIIFSLTILAFQRRGTIKIGE